MTIRALSSYLGNMRRCLLFLLFGQSVIALAAGPSKTLAQFPNANINAVQVGASGNIYIAGYQGTLGTPASYDAFVTKLSPDASQTLYSVKFAGSQDDEAIALALDSAGDAYVFGITQSPNFPVTTGVLQSTFTGTAPQGFVAKIGANGTVIYSTLFGSGSMIEAGPGSLVVDSAGDAIVSSQVNGGTFPSTPSAPFTSADANTNFVLKLAPTGAKMLGAIRGIGGLLALDSAGNIYVAGISQGETIPITPGAFQSTVQSYGCEGTGQLGLGCPYQYVTKLNNTLTQIVYSTYLDGSYGASSAAIFVDAQSEALLAGTTNSPDYPTTSDAFEPTYIAAAPAGPQTNIFGAIYPPPSSGYVTWLNATGTALIYSTFFSGTLQDTVGFAALTSNGLYLSGQAGSPDLPALEGVPVQCLPQNFETMLSLDGKSITPTHLVPGGVLTYDAYTNTLLSSTGSNLISFDPTAPPNHIGCILDAADLQPVTSVAPGELLSIFGADLASSSFSETSPYPTSVAG